MAEQLSESQIEDILVRYLWEKKEWKREDYRIEPKNVLEETEVLVVWAVYLEDERNPVPGGGKSLIFHIDQKEGKVLKELGFQ